MITYFIGIDYLILVLCDSTNYNKQYAPYIVIDFMGLKQNGWPLYQVTFKHAPALCYSSRAKRIVIERISY